MTIALWIVWFILILVWGTVVSGLIGFTVTNVGPVALWGLAALILLILLVLAGREINGLWAGALIDSRNKISLSRLQITLWTVMVLSAFLTMALPRVVAMTGKGATLTQQQALDISFPEQLILAMGISAVSFAGSNLIKSSKRTRQFKIEARATPEESAADRLRLAQAELDDADADITDKAQRETDQKVIADAAQADAAANPTDTTKGLKALQENTLYRKLLNDKEGAVKNREAKNRALQAAKEEMATISESQGLLHKNADPSEANWVDLFRGEEIGNYKQVDMSKVQMLFFTLVVIVAYSAALSGMLRDAELLRTAPSLSFPAFSDSLNALLGISHGTYLSVKSVDHS